MVEGALRWKGDSRTEHDPTEEHGTVHPGRLRPGSRNRKSDEDDEDEHQDPERVPGADDVPVAPPAADEIGKEPSDGQRQPGDRNRRADR